MITSKVKLSGLLTAMFYSSMALSGTMDDLGANPWVVQPIFALQGGYASINAGRNAQFVGTDDNVFSYSKASHGKDAGFVGGFVGLEQNRFWFKYPELSIQAGIEYNYFTRISIHGVNNVGIEPETSTAYQYQYNFRAQQVLATFKMLMPLKERFSPYFEAGLGASFNNNGRYQVNTLETGIINISPTFSNNNTSDFSYILGLGLDTLIGSKLKVGLGYRYSDFGKANLGQGVVSYNNYQAPVAFTLGRHNACANQLLARISYLA